MDTATKCIKWEVNAHVAEILLDSPPVNCISKELLRELDEIVGELGGRSDVRAVVLGSANQKIFCAGADVKQFLTWDEQAGRELSTWGSAIFKKLSDLPVPIVCAVNGGAYGGGLELALACDIRVIEKTAKIALPECKLGVLPAYGGVQRLTKLAGKGHAALLLYTADTITGETAYAYQICEKSCEEGQALSVAREIAAKIAANGPLAVRAIKKCQRECEDIADASLANEFFGKLCCSEQMGEGVSAFLEKRVPDFIDETE